MKLFLIRSNSSRIRIPYKIVWIRNTELYIEHCSSLKRFSISVVQQLDDDGHVTLRPTGLCNDNRIVFEEMSSLTALIIHLGMKKILSTKYLKSKYVRIFIMIILNTNIPAYILHTNIVVALKLNFISSFLWSAVFL